MTMRQYNLGYLLSFDIYTCKDLASLKLSDLEKIT